MSADGSYGPEDLAMIQGDNGDWDSINTLVFMITSFTTVGYGNHPSFVTTAPPCEYPGSHTSTENPFSNLMPVSMRQQTYGKTQETTRFGNPAFGNQPLDMACFQAEKAPPPECWVIADADRILDFSTLRMFERHNVKEEPRRYKRLAIGSNHSSTTTDPELGGQLPQWPDTSEVPPPSNKYRDHFCKNIKMTGFYHTILKFSDTGS